METRVLTLFDDEDFFQKEEPRKKPVREVKAKETANRETAQDNNIEASDEHLDTTAITEEHVVSFDGSDAVTEDGIAITTDHATIDHPEHIFPEEGHKPGASHTEQPENIAGDEDLPWNGEPDVTVPEEEPAGKEVTDTSEDELNKQILSELIQTDYTALIHRDYPFDLNHAKVVEKNAPVEKAAADTMQQDDTEEDEVFEDVVPLPEWKLDKKYYSIGEVAQLFAVNTSHIRFWTNEFKLKPRTTRKGDRLYNPADIAELRLIHHLVKEKKHTIKGAKEKLKAGKNSVNTKLDLKDALLNLRDTLLQIKAQL